MPTGILFFSSSLSFLSSPSSPLDTMNFMEPIEKMHEDNLPTVLEVFQEDAFLDIEEQCNQVWFDLVDGGSAPGIQNDNDDVAEAGAEEAKMTWTWTWET